MYLNSLKPAKGSTKAAKRVGRGIGSGNGKTVSIEIGPLEEDRFRGAVSSLIERHDALRVTIDSRGDAQRVMSDVQPSLDTVDLTRHEADHQSEVIESILPRDVIARLENDLAEAGRLPIAVEPTS